MGLVKGLVGFGLGASILAGGAYSVDKSIEAYGKRQSYEACAKAHTEIAPIGCPEPAFISADIDRENVRYGVAGWMGAIGMCGGGVTVIYGLYEVFRKED